MHFETANKLRETIVYSIEYSGSRGTKNSTLLVIHVPLLLFASGMTLLCRIDKTSLYMASIAHCKYPFLRVVNNFTILFMVKYIIYIYILYIIYVVYHICILYIIYIVYTIN